MTFLFVSPPPVLLQSGGAGQLPKAEDCPAPEPVPPGYVLLGPSDEWTQGLWTCAPGYIGSAQTRRLGRGHARAAGTGLDESGWSSDHLEWMSSDHSRVCHSESAVW